jgi:hypothetical protein
MKKNTNIEILKRNNKESVLQSTYDKEFKWNVEHFSNIQVDQDVSFT